MNVIEFTATRAGPHHQGTSRGEDSRQRARGDCGPATGGA
jgi:hypothetical protein